MIERNNSIWRVRERKNGLGLCCAEDGLFLGITPLLERSAGAFAPRSQEDLEALLSRGFGFAVSLDRVMGGLGTVAAALTAGDLCRARIAAVHLRISDLPDTFARLDMQLEDVALKLSRIAKTTAAGDWNPTGGGWDPDKHPRTGTAPNPGWFASTSSDDDNVSPTLVSDKLGDDGRVHLPPGERNDEIGDLLEWIANAKPEDAEGINSEIDRLFSQVGDFQDAAALHSALGTILSHPDDATRQSVLDAYEPITHRDDPSKGADLITDLATNALFGPAFRFPKPSAEATTVVEEAATAEGTAATEEAASEFWKLGWAARGQEIEEAITSKVRGARTGPSYPVVDFMEEDGTITSIKSIDLNGATYQDAGRLTYRINDYVKKLADFDGATYGKTEITGENITGKVLNIAVPKGSITAIQKGAIDSAVSRAKTVGITLKITPF
ncbi:MAG TPA: hypothetical protein VGF92_08355 [Stellaceae bacterium]